MTNKLYKNLELARIELKTHIYKKAGIYQLVNLEDANKTYVGSSNNLQRRLNEYLNPLGLSKTLERGRSHIINALLKHGYVRFGIIILEFIDLDSSLPSQVKQRKIWEREEFYIRKLNPVYNILSTAGNDSGLYFPEETRKKMRENNNRNQKIFAYKFNGSLYKAFISITEASLELDISRRVMADRLNKSNKEPVHLINKSQTEGYVISINPVTEDKLSELINSLKSSGVSFNQKIKGHNKQKLVYAYNPSEGKYSFYNSLAAAAKNFDTTPSTILKYAKSNISYKGFILSLNPLI